MHFVIPLVFKVLILSFMVIFLCVWFLLLLIITLPRSFSSSTLLACDSRLQPIKIAQFFRQAQDMGKLKKTRQFVTPMKKTVNRNYYAGWLNHPSETAFLKLPEWHQCNQVQDALSFHPHFAKFFQLKNQTSFELQVHIGKPTRWNVVILKWMDEDDLFPIFSSSCDFALWHFTVRFHCFNFKHGFLKKLQGTVALLHWYFPSVAIRTFELQTG